MIDEEIYLKFEFFQGAKTIQPVDYERFTDTCFWDFSSNSTFIGSLAEQMEEWNAIGSNLTRETSGSYLLLGIIADQSPFICAAIHLDWLSTQVNDPTTIDRNVGLVVDSWLAESSLFISKYRLFQKEYLLTTQKQLLKKNYTFQFLYDFVLDLQVGKMFKESLVLEAQSFRLVEFRKIQDIEKKLIQNLEGPIAPVKEMARMAGMSVSKFKLLFFDMYGESPHQYILDKKLVYARELLQSGQYSITQIAYKLGYNHPSGFTRIYKKKFNSPPSLSYIE